MLLFLGAGASINFGIPDTKKFISVFENKVGSENIYIRLKEGITEDLFDTEVLMTLLFDLSKPKEELMNSIAPHTFRFLIAQKDEIKYWLEDENMRMKCHDMLKTIRREIRVKCLIQAHDEHEKIMESYDKFFGCLSINKAENAHDSSLMQYPKLDIFTTNYDTCIEDYFSSRQVKYYRGIVDQFGEFVLDVTNPFSKDHQINIAKLHGSIDLFINKGRVRIIPGTGMMDAPSPPFLSKYGTEFMIYPVESSSAIELLKSPIIEMIHTFRISLINQRTWMLIGSTFRDLTLASIMNDVIAQMPVDEYPRVIHINPEATGINNILSTKGYHSLASVIKPMDAGFIDEQVISELSKIHLS